MERDQRVLSTDARPLHRLPERDKETIMSTKDEIITQLTEKGIEHDPSSTKAELEALLPKEGGSSETIGDIEITDPQTILPKELPLVIKPAKGGEWKNPEQARYAATLNGYAYRNPEKFAAKKGDKTVKDPVTGKETVVKGLISKLQEIGEDPSKLALYESNNGGLTFKNNDLQR